MRSTIEAHVPTFNERLPEGFISILKSHPIYAFKGLTKGGEGLTLRVQHYAADGIINHENKIFLGETNQADFTAKVLRQIFPEASMPDQKDTTKTLGSLMDFILGDDKRDENEIRFVIFDNTTFELKTLGPTHLNMPLIKMANPLVVSGQKNKLRENLKLSKNKKVVSVYGNLFISVNNSIHGAKIAETLIEKSKASVVILTRESGLSPSSRAVFFDESLNQKYSVYNLSEILAGEKVKKFPVIVLNDTKGRMPLIYESADLAVITGAVNIFESLLSQVPTVVVTDDRAIGGYNAEVYKRSIDVAMQTRGLAVVSSVDDLSKGVEEAFMFSREEIRKPYLSVTENGQTMVELYLDRLQEIIEVQLVQK